MINSGNGEDGEDCRSEIEEENVDDDNARGGVEVAINDTPLQSGVGDRDITNSDKRQVHEKKSKQLLN